MDIAVLSAYLYAIALFAVIVFFWCLAFAIHEKEIEGPNGWAKILPTARYHYEDGVLTFRAFNSEDWVEVDSTTLWHRFIIKYIAVLGGKDWTYYHRNVDVLQFFVALLAVCFCFMQLSSWYELTLRIVATVMLIWSIEDTLWFYVNPCAHLSGHHSDWVTIFGKRFMERGMFMNFINGWILMILSFFLSFLGHWAWPYLVNAWHLLQATWLVSLFT